MNNWLQQYKEKTKCTDGEFGHNCEENFLPKFKKLEQLGVELEIENYYTLIVKFPKNNTNGLLVHSEIMEREAAKTKVLLFILTNLPGCSDVNWSEKKQSLRLEWHF